MVTTSSEAIAKITSMNRPALSSGRHTAPQTKFTSTAASRNAGRRHQCNKGFNVPTFVTKGMISPVLQRGPLASRVLSAQFSRIRLDNSPSVVSAWFPASSP